MAFGLQDTARMCEQNRATTKQRLDGQHHALLGRLERVEQAVRYLAALQSARGLTDDEIACLDEIALGSYAIGAKEESDCRP
jgi:hypothetical protein